MHICALPEVMPLQARLCRWPKPHVTWTIAAWLPDLGQAAQLEAFRLAWSSWASVCGIVPEYQTSNPSADVVIRYGQIDGPAGTLAWSELPCGGAGRLKQLYDRSERWVISDRPAPGQIDLVRVAAHEIGHVIGIPHITSGNLLQPTYDPRIRSPQAGDIAEAVARYGRPQAFPIPGPVPSPTPVPAPAPIPQPKPGGRPVNKDTIRGRIEFFLAISRGLARLTPTQIDDQMIAVLERVTGEDWFLDLVAFVLNRFGNAGEISSDQMAGAFTEFFQGRRSA